MRLYSSAEALRTIAKLIREGAPAQITLASPPEDIVELAPIRVIHVLAGEGPIIRMNEDVVEITGAALARDRFAKTFENLADTPELPGPVSTHADLEYFPGHGFLSEDSMWMTVILLF